MRYIYQYKHKETGLFLKKTKCGYASCYKLDKKGKIWCRDVLKTLSLTKDAYGNKFKAEEFETIKTEINEL